MRYSLIDSICDIEYLSSVSSSKYTECWLSLIVCRLVYASENLVSPANTRADLFILSLGVAILVELGLHWQSVSSITFFDQYLSRTHQRCEEWATEPDSIALALVRDDIDLNTSRPGDAATGCFACLDTSVDELLEVALETLAEVGEHGRASRKDDILSTQGLSGLALWIVREIFTL